MIKRQKLAERVAAALYADNTIAITKKELETAEGYREDYLNNLGLSKQDLKTLENAGLAVRGYTPINKGGKLTKGKEIRRVWRLLKESTDA